MDSVSVAQARVAPLPSPTLKRKSPPSPSLPPAVSVTVPSAITSSISTTVTVSDIAPASSSTSSTPKNKPKSAIQLQMREQEPPEVVGSLALSAPVSASPVPSSAHTPTRAASSPSPEPVPGRSEFPANSNLPVPSDDDFERGVVTCENCKQGIPFRDSNNALTLNIWDEHRQKCAAKGKTISTPAPPPSTKAPEPSVSVLADSVSMPPLKKRRAKRTEEERIDYLRTDEYVAQFEAYRVLCAICSKWIRLRPNSTYCSIPWDAHRKSCLSRKSHGTSTKVVLSSDSRSSPQHDRGSLSPSAERSASTIAHPPVARSSLHSSLANTASGATLTSPRSAPLSGPAVGSALTPGSGSSVTAFSAVGEPTPSVSSTVTVGDPSGSPTGFRDLNPVHFTPGSESRRRNAEQREAALRADSLLLEVESNRVFCRLCSKWVQLRQDSSFCAYPWVQHRAKCLARHQRKGEKTPSGGQAPHPVNGRRNGVNGVNGADRHPSEDERMTAESEEGAEFANGDDSLARLAARHKANKASSVADWQNKLNNGMDVDELDADADGDLDAEGDPDEDAEGDPDVDADGRPHVNGLATSGAHVDTGSSGVNRHVTPLSAPPRATHGSNTGGSLSAYSASHHNHSSEKRGPGRPKKVRPLPGDPQAFAELDSITGRTAFLAQSVRYLLHTTYEKSDELTINALVNFVNAAMPTDKHEDFDYQEVAKAVSALNARGALIVEGDVLKLPK